MRVFIFLSLLAVPSLSGCSTENMKDMDGGYKDMRGDYLSLTTVSYHPAGRDDVTCFFIDQSLSLSCIKER